MPPTAMTAGWLAAVGCGPRCQQQRRAAARAPHSLLDINPSEPAGDQRGQPEVDVIQHRARGEGRPGITAALAFAALTLAALALAALGLAATRSELGHHAVLDRGQHEGPDRLRPEQCPAAHTM